jgi:hypothetical protein
MGGHDGSKEMKATVIIAAPWHTDCYLLAMQETQVRPI